MLAIFVQLALAVHYVHAQGILHRDLKAANVFMAPGGVAKLVRPSIRPRGIKQRGPGVSHESV